MKQCLLLLVLVFFIHQSSCQDEDATPKPQKTTASPTPLKKTTVLSTTAVNVITGGSVTTISTTQQPNITTPANTTAAAKTTPKNKTGNDTSPTVKDQGKASTNLTTALPSELATKASLSTRAKPTSGKLTIHKIMPTKHKRKHRNLTDFSLGQLQKLRKRVDDIIKQKQAKGRPSTIKPHVKTSPKPSIKPPVKPVKPSSKPSPKPSTTPSTKPSAKASSSTKLTPEKRNLIKMNTAPKPESSHFAVVFLVLIALLFGLYALYHNRQKIIAVVVEGRTGAGRGVRDHYRKLDDKSEEPEARIKNSSEVYVY